MNFIHFRSKIFSSISSTFCEKLFREFHSFSVQNFSSVFPVFFFNYLPKTFPCISFISYCKIFVSNSFSFAHFREIFQTIAVRFSLKKRNPFLGRLLPGSPLDSVTDSGSEFSRSCGRYLHRAYFTYCRYMQVLPRARTLELSSSEIFGAF